MIRFSFFFICLLFSVTAETSFKGRIVFPDHVNLILHPMQNNLPGEKKYLSGIVTAILADQLDIIGTVYFPGMKPSVTEYPYPYLRDQNGKITEDPAAVFQQGSAVPEYFRMKLIRMKEETVFGEFPPENTDDLRSDGYHLFSQLKSWNTGKFVCRLVLYRGGKKLSDADYALEEEKTAGDLQKPVDDLRRQLAGGRSGHLTFDANLPDASVYINDRFTGKTPLTLRYLPVLEYDLEIRKEGYEPWRIRRAVERDSTTLVKGDLKVATGKGSLSISSSPDGASVYLGVEYKGRTPLKLNDVPFGIHRIRLTREQHADVFRTVDLESATPDATLNLLLQRGRNEDVYRLNPPVLWGLTWRGLFFASVAVSALSAGTGLYFQVQRDTANDLAARRTILVNSAGSSTQADVDYISGQTSDANRYQNISSGFYVTAGVFLVTAGYCFLKYLESQDLEISMMQPGGPSSLAFRHRQVNFFAGQQLHSREEALVYHAGAVLHF